MEACLPLDKVHTVRGILQFGGKKSCTKRELTINSLFSRLNFASQVVRLGRSFVSYLIKLSTTVTELHHHVWLTEKGHLDISMWIKFLSGWNGVSMFLHDDITSSADLQYTQIQLTLILVVSMVTDGFKTDSPKPYM